MTKAQPAQMPVTQNQFESDRLGTPSQSRKRTVRPTGGLPRPLPEPSGALPARICLCGCGESFIPTRKDQKFLPQHRFRTYKTHRCEACGVVHRMGVRK